MEVRVSPREEADARSHANPAVKWRSAARAAVIIAVLGIGWLVGLKTQESTILTQGFTWLGQSAITVTSKLDAWREYILASGHATLPKAEERREQPDTAAVIQPITDVLDARMDQLRASSDAINRQLSSRIDLLTGSVERSQREVLTKLDQLQKQLKNVELRAASAASTKQGQTRDALKSTPAPAQSARSSPSLLQAQRSSEAGDLPRVGNWSVWDVVDGTAILEGPEGFITVSPGDAVPGAGRVEAIVRRGGRWVVATTKGTIFNR
jgi:hypothetical protein